MAMIRNDDIKTLAVGKAFDRHTYHADGHASPLGQHHIYHLAKYYPPVPGGIETHVQTLARVQAALGAQVTVICINGTTKSNHCLQSTKTVEEWDGDIKVVRIGQALKMARLDVCPELPEYLEKIARDPQALVHLHTPNPTMVLSLFNWPARIPLIITHHSDIIKQQMLKYALRPFEYILYQRAQRILTTSAQYIQGSRFLKVFKAPKNKVDVLPLGLDIRPYTQPNTAARQFATQLRQQYGDTPIWLTVGRLVYYKALHVAIEALTHGPGILYVIGSGPLEAELKELATKLGVADRVVWHGKATADELAGAYQAADALWFPSNARSEAFGLVQVEAMASGCPVINADIPCSGVTWVSRHQQEGLTIPLNDPLALAQASQRLLTEEGLRQRLAEQAKHRAMSLFEHTVMGKRSLAVYEQVLNPAPVRTESEQVCLQR
jgi:glycosyltransferase involved in cell wall biosynthesis